MADVFVTVLERICPPGGTVDDAIARDAYLEAVNECMTPQEGGAPIEFTEALAVQLLESFATHTICLRISNDVGVRALDVAPSIATAINIEEQLRDFVQGAVHDAVDRIRTDGASLDRVEAIRIADEIYPVAWDLLVAISKKEGGDE
jgi:hypothetical protein